MDISYLGHSSFRIRTKNATVITDPFDPGMVGLKFAKQSADIVTISHDHKDHNNLDDVKEVKKVVNGPGEYEIMGVSIIGMQTYHDEEKGAKRGKNTVYIFEADELTVCHLGDLGHKLSDKEVEELGDIDVLLIPVGGEYTIGPTQAAELVRSIEPKIVIPMHYQTEGLNPDGFSMLKDAEAFLSEVGLTPERLPKLVVKKSELPEEQKAVILEIKQ